MTDSTQPTGARPGDLTNNDLDCQAVKATNGPGAGVSFEITYRDPSTGDVHQLVVTESISAGREPSGGGLTLCSGRHDQSISADAVLMSEEDGQVVISNTSTYADIEVRREAEPVKLKKNVQLKFTGSATVVVPGRVFLHEIVINSAEMPVDNSGVSGTENFLPSDYEIPAQRREVLAHLCAPMFYPHFSARQTAAEISARIRRRGTIVSPKEVNNKIQRTKDSVEEHCLTELSDRDELAAFLVTHNLITKQDVDDFVIGG